MANIKKTVKSKSAKGNNKAKVGKATSKQAEKKTIGSVAIASLRKNPDAQAALAAVKKAFPKSATKLASIYWYASHEGIRLQKAAAQAA